MGGVSPTLFACAICLGRSFVFYALLMLRAASNLYYNVQVMLRDVQCSDAPHSKIEHKITRGLGNWVGKVARRYTQVSQFKDTLG